MRAPSKTRAARIRKEYIFLEDTEAEPCKQLAQVSQHPLASSASNDNVQEICQTFRWLGDFLNLFSVPLCLRGESFFLHSLFTSTGPSDSLRNKDVILRDFRVFRS